MILIVKSHNLWLFGDWLSPNPETVEADISIMSSGQYYLDSYSKGEWGSG